MKNSTKSKIILSAMLIAGIVLSMFSGVAFYFAKNKTSNVFATNTAIEKPISVKKVVSHVEDHTYTLPFDENGNVVVKQTSENTNDELSQTIKNGELIILDSGTLINGTNSKEVILVGFNLGKLLYDNGTLIASPLEENENGSGYYTLQVNAYLNGRELKTNEQIKDQGAEDSKYYYQILDLDTSSTSPLTFADGSLVTDIEGEYKFVFDYSKKTNGAVETSISTTINFYVFNAETYSNLNGSHTQPRLYNTEKIARENFSNGVGQTEYNYFNYNNKQTTGYDGNKSADDKLLLPTIDYDVTKYNLRYTASLYGSSDEYEYIFDGYDSLNNPILYVYKNGNLVSSKSSTTNGVTTISLNSDDNILKNVTIKDNIASVTLSSISQYDITFNYVYANKQYDKATKKYTTTYLINSQLSDGYLDDDISFVKKANWDVLGDVRLFAFGYQLYYSDYENNSATGSLEFTNGDVFTDVTFLNSNTSFDQSSTLSVSSTIASTNQAPVTLQYYASMTLQNSKTESYYKYWTDAKSYLGGKQPTIVNNITNNTRFTQNGYYQVFVKYNFTNYKMYSGDQFVENPESISHYQYFSFAINNGEPVISVKDENQNNINTNGYTNQDVTISWTASSVFDIAPRITILKQTFSDLQNQTGIWQTVYSSNGQNFVQNGVISVDDTSLKISKNPTNYVSCDTNGYYQVVINYGLGTQTLAKYRFTIDYQDIEGISTYAITNLDENSQLAYSVVTSNILNSAFALSWDDKPSNATISASYSFIGLEKDDSLISNNLSLLPSASSAEQIACEITSSLSLFNGYKLSSIINSSIPYTKAQFKDGTLSDINSMCINAGLYIFKLTDSAGNTTYKLLFVDSSKSVAYSFTNERASYEQVLSKSLIASRDTIVIWGNSKALKVPQSTMDILNDSYADYLQEFEFGELCGENTLLIANNNVVSTDSSLDNNIRYTDNHTINKSYQVFYIKYTDAQKQEINTSTNAQLVKNKYWNYGEHIHNIDVKNSAQLGTDNSNKVYANTLNISLEMNGDNSLLMAYVTNGSLSSSDRLINTGATNKSSLYLEWYQNNDNEFEVKDISVYYYPLTFDQTSPNYPYSASSQKTIKIDLESALSSSLNTGKVISSTINLENNVSLEGMYLVRREYKIGLDENNDSDDYSPRYYLFFIDRNKIISYTSSLHLIGDQIGLNIGTNSAYKYDNYQMEFSGTDFLTNTSETAVKFATSKLPIKWINKVDTLNKFSSINFTISQNPSENSLLIGDEDTKYKISNQVVNTFTLNAPQVYFKERQSETFALSTDTDVVNFSKNGYYQIVLSDKAGNTFTFTFQVAVETPRANVAKYVKNNNSIEYSFYTEGEENISTNQKQMIVAWNRPVSEVGYDAEIDLYNFKITAQFENGKNAEFIVKNGVLTSNLSIPRTASLTIHDISTDDLKQASSFISPTWDYYIDFADIFDLLPSELDGLSANFAVTLKYVGNESDYASLTNVSPNNYFYIIKNIVFDFNKPEYNLNRLLSSDLYLNTHYQDSNTLKQQFEDYTSDINFENYAFVVDKNFTLDQMVLSGDSIYTNSNMDTYKMYIRQYNKYQDDSIKNQQSIVPDDERFNSNATYTNHYRFNETYQENGVKLYTDISELYWNSSEHQDYTLEYILNKYGFEYNTYYEIIEVDFAGNYRVYTIYVKENLDDTISSATFVGTDTSSGYTQTLYPNFSTITNYTFNQTSKQVGLVTIREQQNQIASLEYEKLYAEQLVLTDLVDVINGYSLFAQKYIFVNIQDVNNNKIISLEYYPNGDLDQFASDINSAISAHSLQTGNIYYLTFTTSFGEVLKIEHRKPSSSSPAYTISTTSTGFTIQFTVNINDASQSAYFNSFNAYQAENGVVSDTSLATDSSGLLISSDIEQYLSDNGITSYTFSYLFTMRGSSGSEYHLKFTDNFGREFTIRQIIGVEDNQDKIVYYKADQYQQTLSAYEKVGTQTNPVNITYTSGYALIKFQNVLNSLSIYKLSLTKVGTEYVLNNLEQIDIDENLYSKSNSGIWTYPLITADTENDSIYKVVFTSTVGSTTYYVGYHNTLGEVSIVNASDNSKIVATNKLKATFDKTIYINISNSGELFSTNVSVIREYVSNGQTLVQEIGTINSGQTFTDIGVYTFTVYNALGTQISFTITIEEKINNNYWITYKIGGIDAGTLTPTSQDKSIQGTYGSFANPITYFTIYDYELKTNTTNGYNFALVDGSSQSLVYGTTTVGTTVVYEVFKLVDDQKTNQVYLSITKVNANSNFIRSYGNSMLINNAIQTSTYAKITPNTVTNVKTAILSLAKTYNLASQNAIILSYTFGGELQQEINLNTATESDLTFSQSGVYDFYFSDLAGNKQMFGNNSFFRMYLLNDVIFKVNANTAVNNAVFNNSVVISLEQVSQFDNSKIDIVALLNGNELSVRKINNTYTFSDYGLYQITLSGKVNQRAISTNYTFRIINLNEAMATFEYVGLNNYKITKVTKLDTKDSIVGDDITTYLKQQYGDLEHLSYIALSTLENGVGGAGIYEIFVQAILSNTSTQQFSFKVWLNNDTDVLINSSIEHGGSTTKEITISLNKSQIYNKIGDCTIYYNDTAWITIDSTSAGENKTTSYNITQTGQYNIRIITKSGNTLSSFVVTKNEPLNTVAIVVIVLSILAVGAITFVFIKLRKNMKVK